MTIPPLPFALGGATLINCQYGSTMLPADVVGIGIRVPDVVSPGVRSNVLEPWQVAQSCANSPRVIANRMVTNAIFFIKIWSFHQQPMVGAFLLVLAWLEEVRSRSQSV